MFDVDDTLIMWLGGCDLEDAVNAGITLDIPDPSGRMSNTVVVNDAHVDLLKRYKGKGKFIIVWTASGYEWGQRVVETLNLTEYVDLVMTKPAKYVDDTDANEWMEHVYLGTPKASKNS